MAPYLTLTEFRDYTVLPAADVDDVEARFPGWIARQLDAWSREIDARLTKRYVVPFATPYPITILEWLARIVTPRVMWKRGVDANDRQYQDIRDDAIAAEASIKEAADSEKGLYELPLRNDTAEGAIARATPLAYSEQSPYVWMDQQADIGRDEDADGIGTGDG